MRRAPNRSSAIEIIDQANRIQAWQDAQTVLINAAGVAYWASLVAQYL